MKIIDDPKIQQVIARKGLSKSRIKIFNAVFKQLYEITGLAPSEMIEEIREEQKPYIKNNEIVFNNIEDHKITTYFYQLYNYLKNLNRSKKQLKIILEQ